MTFLGDLRQTRKTSRRTAFGEPGDAASIMFPDSRLLNIDLRRSRLVTDILTLGLQGLTLGRVSSPGHEIEIDDPANLTLLLAQQGRIDVRIAGSDHAFASGSLALLRPGLRRTRVTAPPRTAFVATTLQIASTRVQALAAAQDAAGLFPLRDATALTGEMARYAARIWPQVATDVFRQRDTVLPDRVAAEFSALTDDVLCEILGLDGQPLRSRRVLHEYRRASMAADIMHAECEDPISIAALAQRLGITSRSLQMSFHHVYGKSPRQYLDDLRLHKARHRLLSGTGAMSVTAIALDCGFLHLGRFAQSYGRAFGERPSETLARRQG